jgi:hypothetical protein
MLDETKLKKIFLEKHGTAEKDLVDLGYRTNQARFCHRQFIEGYKHAYSEMIEILKRLSR